MLKFRINALVQGNIETFVSSCEREKKSERGKGKRISMNVIFMGKNCRFFHSFTDGLFTQRTFSSSEREMEMIFISHGYLLNLTECS
jgi:hypothetical protein